MKIISDTSVKGGLRKVVVLVADAEVLVGVKPTDYYKLGEPLHEDVVEGHVLANASRVAWCPIEQRWTT